MRLLALSALVLLFLWPLETARAAESAKDERMRAVFTLPPSLLMQLLVPARPGTGVERRRGLQVGGGAWRVAQALIDEGAVLVRHRRTRIEAYCFGIVGECAIELPFGEKDSAAGVVEIGIARVDLDRFVVVRQGSDGEAFLRIGETTIPITRRRRRPQPQRLVVFLYSAVEISQGEEREGAPRVRPAQAGIETQRLREVRPRSLEVLLAVLRL